MVGDVILADDFDFDNVIMIPYNNINVDDDDTIIIYPDWDNYIVA